MPSVPVYPSYPSTTPGVLRLAFDRQPRSFRHDARPLVDRLQPPLRVGGAVPDLSRGSWVLVVNHYSRPGFKAWWFTMAISSVIDRDIHWVMTSTLTYPDFFRSHTLTPASQWLLRRIARIYGFTSMPPMPPRPWEVEARAWAVRRVLHLAERQDVLIGLAPEGGDTPGGRLTRPPKGTERFLALLARRVPRFVPVGVFEESGRLCLRFGPTFQIPAGSGEVAGSRPMGPADVVMRSIAACLPAALRGEYAG